jgi:hypothetical protein
VQAKATGLTISQPDDQHEKEADLMAARAMGSQGGLPTDRPQASRDLGVQRKCSACEEEETMHRKADGGAHGSAAVPGIVSDVLSSPGQPLDKATRGFMEERFGHDFSDVRIHVGERAAKSAQAVSAQAYTVGQHIVFGAGYHAPGSRAGNELLAHELAHTIQQGRPGTVARFLQRRVICPEGVTPSQGTGCRSESGTCADLLQASAPQGTRGCWDSEPAPQQAAQSTAAPSVHEAPRDQPSPFPGGGLGQSPGLDSEDPLWPGCQGDCHARHPNMGGMTEICPLVKSREQENGFTVCLYQCRTTIKIRVVGPGQVCPRRIVNR